jgi:hypothetical protein
MGQFTSDTITVFAVNVGTVVISAQDLTEGEFSSILRSDEENLMRKIYGEKKIIALKSPAATLAFICRLRSTSRCCRSLITAIGISGGE